MYFMIGNAWACASYNTIFGKVIVNNRNPMWISLAIYFASQGVMLGLIELLISVPLTAVCSFVSGFSLMNGMIATLSILLKYA